MQEAAEKLAHQETISKKQKPEPKELIKKPAPLKISQQERRKSALSLSSLKRQKEEDARFKKKKTPTENTADLPKDPFTQEQFDQVWNDYIAELHGGGEKILASILKADAPKIRNNQIHVVYPNEMMKVELLKVRPKVLRRLKENLNNYHIDFHITVNEDTTKRFAYTPQEKYELLKEKNKAISELRKRFNLEL